MHLLLDRLLWHGQQLSIRPAELQDVPRLVDLHRLLVGESPPAERTADPLAWFALGGPWMHPYFCERHLKAYQDLGFDVWLVVAGQDEFVGTIELWYDHEPEPFGCYGHIELLELLPQVFTDEVENWLIERAEARALDRGYHRFWCNPEGSGGSPHILRQRGYEEVWPNAGLTLNNLAKFRPPAYQIKPLHGDYESEAAHLLALNHREAAGFRWRYLWRVVLDPPGADWPLNSSFWAGDIVFEGGQGGLCLVTTWRWYFDPLIAFADLWVAPGLVADLDNTSNLLALAAQQALKMGVERVVAYLPRGVASALAGAHKVMDELKFHAAWYKKEL